jgi:hypothetical protein
VKLPHLPPLHFAKKVVRRELGTVWVLCQFDELPKLTTFIEAAAQSSAAFGSESMIGFLTVVKEVRLHCEPASTEYLIEVRKEVEVGSNIEISFTVWIDQQKIKTASGVLSIHIEQKEGEDG